jgi:hypothetical protein
LRHNYWDISKIISRDYGQFYQSGNFMAVVDLLRPQRHAAAPEPHRHVFLPLKVLGDAIA